MDEALALHGFALSDANVLNICGAITSYRDAWPDDEVELIRVMRSFSPVPKTYEAWYEAVSCLSEAGRSPLSASCHQLRKAAAHLMLIVIPFHINSLLRTWLDQHCAIDGHVEALAIRMARVSDRASEDLSKINPAVFKFMENMQKAMLSTHLKIVQLWDCDTELHRLSTGPAVDGRGACEMDAAATVVDWLLEAGAGICDAAGCGNSPLSHAIMQQEPEMVRVLLAANADINQHLPQADSPRRVIMQALRLPGNDACLRVLLEHGVSLEPMADDEDSSPSSLLMKAVLGGPATLRLLLEHQAWPEGECAQVLQYMWERPERRSSRFEEERPFEDLIAMTDALLHHSPALFTGKASVLDVEKVRSVTSPVAAACMASCAPEFILLDDEDFLGRSLTKPLNLILLIGVERFSEHAVRTCIERADWLGYLSAQKRRVLYAALLDGDVDASNLVESIVHSNGALASWLGGLSTLHLLVASGKADLAKLKEALLTIGRHDANLLAHLLLKPDAGGRTVLHYACISGSAPLTRLLLALGGPRLLATRDTSYHVSALHVAARFGHVECASLLLRALLKHEGAAGSLFTSRHTTPRRDILGATPMHYATNALQNRDEMIAALAQIDPNLLDQCAHSGYAPLHSLCMRGGATDCEVVKALLRAGADPHKLIGDRCAEPLKTSMLLSTADGGTQDYVRTALRLQEEDRGEGLAITIAHLLRMGCSEAAFQAAKMADGQPDAGWSALELSAKLGHKSFVRVLIDNGSHVDFDGCTEGIHGGAIALKTTALLKPRVTQALSVSGMGVHPNFDYLVIPMQPSIQASTISEKTALERACEFGQSASVKALLHRGATLRTWYHSGVRVETAAAADVGVARRPYANSLDGVYDDQIVGPRRWRLHARLDRILIREVVGNTSSSDEFPAWDSALAQSDLFTQHADFSDDSDDSDDVDDAEDEKEEDSDDGDSEAGSCSGSSLPSIDVSTAVGQRTFHGVQRALFLSVAAMEAVRWKEDGYKACVKLLIQHILPRVEAQIAAPTLREGSRPLFGRIGSKRATSEMPLSAYPGHGDSRLAWLEQRLSHDDVEPVVGRNWMWQEVMSMLEWKEWLRTPLTVPDDITGLHSGWSPDSVPIQPASKASTSGVAKLAASADKILQNCIRDAVATSPEDLMEKLTELRDEIDRYGPSATPTVLAEARKVRSALKEKLRKKEAKKEGKVRKAEERAEVERQAVEAREAERRAGEAREAEQRAAEAREAKKLAAEARQAEKQAMEAERKAVKAMKKAADKAQRAAAKQAQAEQERQQQLLDQLVRDASLASQAVLDEIIGTVARELSDEATRKAAAAVTARHENAADAALQQAIGALDEATTKDELRAALLQAVGMQDDSPMLAESICVGRARLKALKASPQPDSPTRILASLTTSPDASPQGARYSTVSLSTVEIAEPRTPTRDNDLPMSEQGVCVVCLHHDATDALIPCGHRCVCQTCAADLLKPRPNIVPACPMCRTEFTGSLRIFAV